MVTTNYPNLANHLRNWGLKVHEVSGWQTRSANTTTFTPIAVLAHHTAGAATGNAPTLQYIIDNKLSQFVLGRDGTVFLVSGNRANHGGLGGPIAGIPKDSANRYSWGIEAENTGRGEPWNPTQLNAYYRLTAALLKLMGKTETSVIGHKEWAPSRKIDPAGIDMNGFRTQVAAALKAGPGDPILKLGDEGPKVEELQNLLNKHQFPCTVDGDFGPNTEKAVNGFKAKNGWPVDGVAGPKVWEGLRKPYVTPAPAPEPTPTPEPAPTTPAYVFTAGRDGVLVQFRGDNHVFEVVGSILVHVTAQAWKARNLSAGLVRVLEPTHPLNELPKQTEY